MLIDVDEWGQVPLMSLLLRYGRTQFVDPDKSKPKKVHYSISCKLRAFSTHFL